MADDLGDFIHLTTRNGVYRVREALRGVFPFARVQKSLGTRDQLQALAAALDLDRIGDGRFTEDRRAGTAQS